MRRIYLLVLAVVLVATLVGLAISEQAGYVLIAYKSFRYESSLWSFLALLAVVWLLVVLVRLVLRLLGSSGRVVNPWSRYYEQALKQAQDVLDGYFNVELADSRALKLRIDELAKQPVTVQVPDLAPALSALQAYVSRREAAGNLVPEAQAAPATEGRP